MKNIILSIVLVAGSFLFYSCSNEREPVKYWTVKGTEFINPEGQAIQLKGIGIGNWLLPEGYMFHFKRASSPRLINEAFTELIGEEQATKFWDAFLENYITLKDIEYMKKIGMNHIRLSFDYRLLTHDDFLGRDFHGYEYLDRAIQWAKQVGMGVVLDMHAAPGGQTGDNIDNSYGYPWLFESKQAQRQTIDLWVEIAKRYKNEPTIIAYELLNEPIAHFFDNKKELNKKLEPLYKDITAEIRKIDANHIIILGGAQWNTNFKVFGKPFDDKLAYAFHRYWMPPVKEEIQEYIDFSDKYQVPIYMSETGENTDSWCDSMRTTLDKEQISWAFWPYKKLDNPRGIISFSRPAKWDAIIKYVETDGQSFQRRPYKVNSKVAKKILDEFIENSKFENCVPQKGYIKALGFKE